MSESDKIIRFPDPGAVEAEAAAWVARLDAGELSAEDRAAFEEWRVRSVQHREAFARLSGLWDELELFREHAPMPEPRRITRRAVWAAAAGLVLALATLLLVALPLRQGSEVIQAHRTVVGEQETVFLADGSSILLNTDSEVEIRYSTTARDVHLVRGEAYFDVAPDRSRPFSVFAGEGVVRAVGTAFAVRLLSDSVEVTVTKGDVALASLAERASATAPEAPQQLAMMSAGQSAVFHDKIERLGVVAEAEINRKLAWRQGMLAFAGEPLSRVVEEISRYTEVEIAIEDPGLNDLRVGGYFKVGEVEAMFEALETSFGVRVEWVDRTHVRLLPAT